MAQQDIVRLTEAGLYCELGDFYIDPGLPVKRAIITHAHSDHARSGNGSYVLSGGRWLNENKIEASSFSTRFEGELGELQPGEEELSA